MKNTFKNLLLIKCNITLTNQVEYGFQRLRKNLLEPIYFDDRYEMKGILSHSESDWGYELVIEQEGHGMGLSYKKLHVEYGFQERSIWITNIRDNYSVNINLDYADVLIMSVMEIAAAYIKVEGIHMEYKINHFKI